MSSAWLKYYYGAWQSFYQLSWPVRFLFEIVFFAGLLCLALWGVRILADKCKLRIRLAKVWCIIVKETVYILGRDKKWAVVIDNRMIDWLQKKTEEDASKRNHPRRRILLAIIVIVIYLGAVFVDLPFSRYVSEEYLSGAENCKAFFQQIETFFSKGCEQYPPLFLKREDVEETIADEQTETEPGETEPVYIQLNDEGKAGANIRSEPDLSDDGNIVSRVNENSQILYLQEWIHDGERYWLRVYDTIDDVEGWLSGKLVDGGQLEEIVAQENEN